MAYWIEINVVDGDDTLSFGSAAYEQYIAKKTIHDRELDDEIEYYIPYHAIDYVEYGLGWVEEVNDDVCPTPCDGVTAYIDGSTTATTLMDGDTITVNNSFNVVSNGIFGFTEYPLEGVSSGPVVGSENLFYVTIDWAATGKEALHFYFEPTRPWCSRINVTVSKP